MDVLSIEEDEKQLLRVVALRDFKKYLANSPGIEIRADGSWLVSGSMSSGIEGQELICLEVLEASGIVPKHGRVKLEMDARYGTLGLYWMPSITHEALLHAMRNGKLVYQPERKKA